MQNIDNHVAGINKPEIVKLPIGLMMPAQYFRPKVDKVNQFKAKEIKSRNKAVGLKVAEKFNTHSESNQVSSKW